MDEPIEEVYFNWLYSKVASVAVPTPSLTYYTLLRDLHSIEFVWLIVGDANRAEDGLALRKEFIRSAYLDEDPPWMSIPCSVLEMFIALTRRASFEDDRPEREWFWIFMDNLGLAEMTDARSRISERVYERVNDFLWRTYCYDGSGGIFPLTHAKQDQREVEIWYQLHHYMDEVEPV